LKQSSFEHLTGRFAGGVSQGVRRQAVNLAMWYFISLSGCILGLGLQYGTRPLSSLFCLMAGN
jgi:hypothetical protein